VNNVAVKLKLKRIGKKHSPFYRIIAIDQKKSTASGAYLDVVGLYNPTTEPKEIKIDAAKVKAWMSKGAQPTVTVAKLLKKANIV
jgi:small subunit ribosomal protein S16